MSKIYEKIHKELDNILGIGVTQADATLAVDADDAAVYRHSIYNSSLKNPNIVPSIHPIGCITSFSHLPEPKSIQDNKIPAIGYKLGTRVINNSITTTTAFKGYTYSVALHATIGKLDSSTIIDEEDINRLENIGVTTDLKMNSLRMIETVDIICRRMRKVTANDESTVVNCEIPVVDNLFKSVFTHRDYLLFQLSFDVVIRA